ncbi:hypothetical protein GCM10010495_43220 [Kitasatospora herbaricolor]|uniref:hypothetical protein n=1 Tax=Kitasatospora herbaricolor TaxID=68217 RepID=UPI00174A2E6F|nr:hypothetical protein [Kitasatospora herbaricolor]MDQ0306132.1 hypothetical protein [Kitasatospora herbaricolor]GGV23138.1 hypothetical protein GCM10010495_43220 [Kitasatospora herbaricolor]
MTGIGREGAKIAAGAGGTEPVEPVSTRTSLTADPMPMVARTPETTETRALFPFHPSVAEASVAFHPSVAEAAVAQDG